MEWIFQEDRWVWTIGPYRCEIIVSAPCGCKVTYHNDVVNYRALVVAEQNPGQPQVDNISWCVTALITHWNSMCERVSREFDSLIPLLRVVYKDQDRGGDVESTPILEAADGST